MTTGTGNITNFDTLPSASGMLIRSSIAYALSLFAGIDIANILLEKIEKI
jgi:hypothetical protein